MRIRFFILCALSLYNAVLLAEEELALLKKNENPVLTESQFFQTIENKFNSNGLKISEIFRQKRKEVSEQFSKVVMPLAQNIASLNENVSGVQRMLSQNSENGKTVRSIPDAQDSPAPALNEKFQPKTLSHKNTVFDYREPLNHSGINFYAEYLLWKPIEDNLEYAVKDTQLSSATDLNAIPPNLAKDANGKYQFAALDIDSGFRLSAGYAIPYDAFQCIGEYTYFYSSGNNTSYKPNNANLFLNGTFRENTEIAVEKAASQINLTLNQLDLRLAKHLQLSEQLLSTVGLGVCGAWVSQDWDIQYTGSSASDVNRISNDWTFSGAGPRLILDLDWHLGLGISIYGLCTGSLVVGNYEFKYNAKNPRFSSFPTGIANYEETRVIPNLQFLTGVNYGQFYKTWGFEFLVGYEVNSWFSIFRLPVTTYLSADGENYNFYRDGTITLQGLTTRIRFAF